MRNSLAPFGLAALLLNAAIFGFFYAWVCSTIWGLNTLDPNVAIEAMQAMNASVRNGVFAPAFFATPFVSFFVAGLAWICGARGAAVCFALAGAVYLGGGMVLTMRVHVPLNEALAQVSLPHPEAATIWRDYARDWEFWNIVRTGFSGLAVLLSGVGLLALRPRGETGQA